MTSATVVYTACQWLTIVFLSRFVGAESLGTYALALAIVTPVITLSNLQLRYLLCSDAKKDFSFGNYVFVRITTVALGLVVICLWSVGQRVATFLVILALGTARSSDAMCDILHGYLQAHGRMDRIAKSLMLQGPLQLTAFLTVTTITHNMVLGIAAAALISMSILVGFDLKSVRLVQQPGEKNVFEQIAPFFHFSKETWVKVRKLMWLGAPMGLVMGLNSLIGNVPRYFLAYNHGQALVGVFAALSYLTLPGGIVVAAYCDSAFAQLARWGAEGNFRQVFKALTPLIVAALVIGLAGWVVAYEGGRLLLSLCYGNRYAVYTPSLIWLMAGACFLYISTVLGYAVTSLREFHVQVPFRVVHLAGMYLVCLYLIPKEGLLGAAKSIFASSVGSAVATAILLAVVLRKRTFFSKRPSPITQSFSAEAALRESDF
jgi:O-antigen/teichoic acid export membrane protein